MNTGALRAAAAAQTPVLAIAYRAAYAVIAFGAVAAAAFSPHNDAALAIDRFVGASIVSNHTVATALGTETFSSVGSPSAAAGWLGALATYGAGAIGGVLATIAALVTLFLVERRARRMGGRAFALVASALALLCAIGSFGAAGGIFTALFAIALAEILDRPGRSAALAATALSCLWCNVASDGLLAPAIAFVFAFASYAGKRDLQETRRRWIAFAGTLVAIVATPGFLAYPAIALENMRLDRGLDGVVFYHPIDVVPIAYRTGFLLMTLAAFAVGGRGRRNGDALILLAAGLLALANGSYVVVFGVLVAPLLAASAAATFDRIANVRLGSGRGDLAVAAVAVVAALGLSVPAAPAARTLAPAYALASTLAHDGKPHRLMCSIADWCDAALVPGSQTRVFMDGRVGAYPQGTRDAQRDLVRLKGSWRHTLSAKRVDAMLLRIDRPLSGVVALLPDWRPVASDDLAVLYERVGSAP